MRYINRLFTYLLTLLSQIAWNESLKFGQLTLGKMIKIVATRCQILKLKPTKHSDVALTSSGRHVHRQRVVIQFLTSGWRPADVSDWSSRRIDDLCDRQRATSSLWQAVRCVVAGGSYLFSATRTDKTAPARLTNDDSQTCMHCQPAVTRRLAQLDTIRPAASACIDWLCWPIVVNMSFSGMYESRL